MNTGLKTKKTNRINNGTPTNDLIFSAYQESNSEVFPLILDLYAEDRFRIADVTYGKGVFWKKVDRSKYKIFATDLKTTDLPEECLGGIDSRKLPYQEDYFDMVVFDHAYSGRYSSQRTSKLRTVLCQQC